MIKSIGIVGGGVVGSATARCWMEHAEVRVYDMVQERRTHGCILDVVCCDVVFICLPENRLDEIFHHPLLIQQRELLANYVIKSTVPIGTTRRLKDKYGLRNLLHSPEFLTARCAATDAQLPARNIIGGDQSPARTLLYDLYTKRFPGVQCLLMTSDESEAVKLFTNSFFAVKVAYFNEIRALADNLSLDWEVVRQGVLADGRIAHSHTQVPGQDGSWGFGGTCLPKDLAMLIKHMLDDEDGNLHADVCYGAQERNFFDRQKPAWSPANPDLRV